MLGDNIRRIRNLKKISINKLSKESGISLGYLSDLENNKAKNPTMDKLKSIAKVLDVQVSDITDEIELYNENNKDPEVLNKLGPAIYKKIIEVAQNDPEASKFLKSLQYKKNISILSDVIKEIILDTKNNGLEVKFKHADYTNTDNIRKRFTSYETLNKDADVIREEPDTYNTHITDVIREEPDTYNTHITDVKEAMDVILAQPGLMLNGEILSDDSKIALANAINMGLAYATQMQQKEKEKKKNK